MNDEEDFEIFPIEQDLASMQCLKLYMENARKMMIDICGVNMTEVSKGSGVNSRQLAMLMWSAQGLGYGVKDNE